MAQVCLALFEIDQPDIFQKSVRLGNKLNEYNIMLPAVSNLCLNITFFLCRLQYPDDMLCPFWHLGKEVCLWQYW